MSFVAAVKGDIEHRRMGLTVHGEIAGHPRRVLAGAFDGGRVEGDLWRGLRADGVADGAIEAAFAGSVGQIRC